AASAFAPTAPHRSCRRRSWPASSRCSRCSPSHPGRPGSARRSVSEALDIRSARSLAPGERADLFNAAYEGYLLPFHVDEAALAFMIDAFDLDLDASRIAFRDGEPVGLGNLGLRGEDAWIGG